MQARVETKVNTNDLATFARIILPHGFEHCGAAVTYVINLDDVDALPLALANPLLSQIKNQKS